MRFLPSLFRRNHPAEPEPAPETKASPLDLEYKLLLADYYTALANFGYGLHESAREWPIERAIREGYDRVIWCFKAISTIGENCAREDIPFEVVEGPPDDEQVVDDHPLSRLLNGLANPMETGEIFLERLSAQLLMSKKGAYVEVTLSNASTPVRLDLLPASRTRIVPGYTTLIDHFEVTRLDGTRYDLPPERVRWIRKPHPLDPYSGVTPLESIGLSLELDYYARLYNVSFMRNDGRPGGIVGIMGPERGAGGLDQADMEILESRFGKGPTEAGKVTVVEGDVSYADLAAKPRDSQYQGVSKNAKTEILSAFGVPESQIGNAADRTFANAEAEGYAFWTITMLPHLSRIASAFLPDVAEGQRPRFNTRAIGVLELPARARRAEAREEVAAGLRSIKSYADEAGYGDQVDDLPHTRALWMPSGRDPLPARAEDAEALGLGAPVEAPPNETAPDDALPGVPTDETSEATAANAETPAPVDGNTAPPGNTAPAATGQLSLIDDSGAIATKSAAPDVETKAAAAWRDIEPDDTETGAAEAIHAALTKLAAGWDDRTRARLKMKTTRKGTRHFKPEYPEDTRVGTKALDSAYAADEQAWSDDTEKAVRPLIETWALAAAAAWLTAATGASVSPDALPGGVRKAALAAAAAAVPLLTAGAAWQARRTARAISDIDDSGGTVEDAVEAAQDRAESVAEWAAGAAEDAAGTVTEAGYTAAAAQHAKTDGVDLERLWLAKRDERTRPTHREAHGQKRGIGAAFKVGGALLRFPKDPLGPPQEVKRCRCRSAWRQKTTGRFVEARHNPAVAS